MKIYIDLSKDDKELAVTIHSSNQAAADKLAAYLMAYEDSILAYDERGAKPLRIDEILCIYTSRKKVYVRTMQGEYEVRQRLYEWEERLSMQDYVRISQSEIVNLHHVLRFDLTMSGSITIEIKNHHKGMVSRRYLPKIRKRLERMKQL